jgi:hypothetical protein
MDIDACALLSNESSATALELEFNVKIVGD